MSGPVGVLAVLRQMHVNSSHFRNGLPVLADHHEGEPARERSAISAVAELIEAAHGYHKARNIQSRVEASARLVAALARVKGESE